MIEDDSLIESVIEKVLALNRQSIDDYLNGKEKAFGFLVGQTMKELKGKGNPKTVNRILKEKLKTIK